MGYTVAVTVDHLPTASVQVTTVVTDRSRTILVPILNPRGTVKSALKDFIYKNLYIPKELQCISAPLFTRLRENESVEDIYSRYCCSAEAESPDLHVDEEKLIFFGKERGRCVELRDEDKLDELHIISGSKLQLKRLPQNLSEEGGRIFVETKDGILPVIGVRPTTKVAEIKRTLEIMTGISVCQQLLYSVGRVMHDDLLIHDFDGLQIVYEDSILDLCKSGDANIEQAHRHMIVIVNLMGEQEFNLLVQGRDLVQNVMQVVESKTGFPQWQQRITFSGKVLQDKRMLADYFIYPECTLDVNIFKSELKRSSMSATNYQQEEQEDFLDNAAWKPAARKLKLVRTNKGQVKGTLSIPVLITDSVSDLKRKIKRTLHPLVERNLSMQSPVKEQGHIDITPNNSPASGNCKTFRPPCSPSLSTDGSTLSCSVSSMQSTVRQANLKNSVRKGCSSVSVHPSLQLVSPLPAAGPLSQVLSNPGYSGHQKQHEEFPPVSPLRPNQSVRRLQFGDGTVAYRPSAHAHVSSKEQFQDSQTENSSTVWLSKKYIGAWLSGSVQTLKEQIRHQFGED